LFATFHVRSMHNVGSCVAHTIVSRHHHAIIFYDCDFQHSTPCWKSFPPPRMTSSLQHPKRSLGLQLVSAGTDTSACPCIGTPRGNTRTTYLELTYLQNSAPRKNKLAVSCPSERCEQGHHNHVAMHCKKLCMKAIGWWKAEEIHIKRLPARS
jgi:hypothetical protein